MYFEVNNKDYQGGVFHQKKWQFAAHPGLLAMLIFSTLVG